MVCGWRERKCLCGEKCVRIIIIITIIIIIKILFLEIFKFTASKFGVVMISKRP